MAKRKIKKGIKNTILILLILLIILGVILFYILNPFRDKIKIYIELGETIPKYLDKGISNENNKCKIIWNNVNNKKIGNYKGKSICNLKKYNIELNVGDTTVPEILGVEDIDILVGESVDLLNNINVKDNSNEKIKAIIEGNYDINKEGNYELKYKACDNSDNCIEEDFTLHVVKDSVIKPKYIDGILIVNKSYPLPDDYIPDNLVSLSNGAQVVDYVKEAFELLIKGSKEEGLNIYPSTAYRSIGFQSTLYNNYVARDGKEKADTYSARPGYSEHHTGLAIDVNDVSAAFNNTNEAKWLEENCYKYGFILRYPKESEDQTGYNYESWHIRYVGEELAKKLYNNGEWITLEKYFNIDSKYKD